MTTYSIRAPDGRTYSIEGPEGATQEQVQSQVMRQFPNAARAAPAPAARPTVTRLGRGARPAATPGKTGGNVELAHGQTSANDALLRRYAGMTSDQATQIYQNARAALARGHTDPAERARALTAFDTDPRTRAIRQVAGLAPLTTRAQDIRDVRAQTAPLQRSNRIDEAGRQAARNRQAASDFPTAVGAGIRRSLFGLPERLAAAGERWLPSALTGNTTDLNYDELLQATRAGTDEELGRSTPGNILGQVLGSVASGRAVGGLVSAGATRLAAAGAPLAQRAGNILQSLTEMRRGQRLANTGRIALAGAGGGAAQAAGEGSDVTTGAITGAIAGPALHGIVQGVRGTAGLVRQAVRPFSRSLPRAMREVITEAPDAIAARQAELSAQTGTNVPAVAALNDRDFRSVTQRILRRSPEATEIAKTHTSGYVRGFMNRMLAHVNNAGREGNAQNTSIGELAQLRRDTADELMHPIRDRTVDLTQLPLDDLERSMTRQIGGRIQGLAPRINQALRDLHPDDLEGMGLDASDVSAARRLMTQWGLGSPVHATVQEMDSLRRALDAAGRSSQASNPANAMAFRNAARVVRDFVADEVPAYGQMVDTYSAQSRMMEGFQTAAAGHRLPDIEDDLLRTNLRTPEGRVGMKAGELYRQREAVTGRTTGAIGAARDFASEGRLTRPPSLEPGAAQPGTVTENLGERAAAGLARASQGETRVLNRMLDTEKVNAMARDEGGALSPEEIVYGAFLGNALASTKARFLAALLSKLPHGLNRNVANNLAERLFSQDPEMTAQAMRALRRAGLTERMVTGLMRNSLPASIAAGGFAAGGSDSNPDAGAQDPGDGEIPSVAGDLGETEAAPEQGAVPEELQGAPQPVTPGNLPLEPQGEVDNGDGTVSTVRTISIGTDQGEVLIPTVIDGRVVSDEEATQHFQETGENFGTFRTAEEADAYAEALHNYHARLVGAQGAAPAGGDSPYAAQLQQLYSTENPELLDLVSRVKHQESGGRQHDRHGRPLTSPAGAIGVMQLIPDTARSAARLAGVRWDPQAYHHDAAYNELLGIAELSEQLRRYDGDVRLALIAYNAGPGRADRVASGDHRIPHETQNYIASIM